ncbi:copper-translocating P-type ATPase [Campylobacter blaseri]|uniref:Copper-translocating P-type ATPase n=1 Tax=Campylobacter blaseri TaxID=2042961 RepID=A0A2P8R2B8_9BACT|nr:cation-translocating P-type ATPase [Campylobacter blaseri]PSM52633.1 copper-translocating P-type ATPase [Campylobacter blaseri]PSM54281.1 copper-translocating P-type ATPase [Campylobacter blaseri]QKF85932.1 copper-translocating P-type ATPase [Campylobacter blaseri]
MSKKIKLNIVGMSCVNCSNAIEKATKKIEGVADSRVSFTTNTGEFEVDSENLKNQIIQKIEKLGFEVATDYEDLQLKKQKALKALRIKLISAFFLMLAVMILHMFIKHSFINSFLQFVLTTIIVFYCGKSFFVHAYGSLKNRNYDMNVLIALGVGSAYLYSSFVFLFPHLVDSKFNYVYFESAAMIVFFILLGKYLEENSKAKANDYIKSLLNLAPKTATLLNSDGTTKDILVENLNIGDIVVVKSGTNIPCDGVVVSGGAEVDTSALTGEFLPVYKKFGDSVNAGFLNTNGFINIEVTKANHETMIARITKLLSEASAKKMPVARLADKVANIFVPIVVAIAILTFITWVVFGNAYYGVMTSISVLVISCPCALGLAVPISIVCAISNLAKNGVLVRNPEVLEILRDTKNVFFDKTGTLTNGKISVYTTNLDNQNLKEVAEVEMLSEHLISKAIVKYAEDKNINLDNYKGEYENIVGMGIKSDNLLIGSEAFLIKNNVSIDEKQKNEYLKFLKNGLGTVLVAKDSKYLGYIVLEDTIRKSAKESIQKLNIEEKNTIMLTGDNENIAKYISKELGIKKVYSGVLPEEKFNIIKEHKNSGKTIFVGDGINDVLSLKEADCGIAMNSGTDIAKSTGDILLINNDLSGVIKLIKISERTMNTIKQNLFWAFIYNIICIPIAAGILYPINGTLLEPHFAALAMSFSSVTVVLNSLRLKFYKV